MRRYIGARYVPVFDGDWDPSKNYENLTIVNYEGFTYTSKIPVPRGTLPTDTDYWVLTGSGGVSPAFEQRLTAVETAVVNAQAAADAAQSTANSAQSAASNALTTANSAQTAADDAQAAADAAQSTANSAQSAANAAQSTANSAQTAASAAQDKAVQVENDMIYNFDIITQNYLSM